ncbi:hypothetical protein HD806DRAFT_539172 [Xylariaceae sp. AK1471]|nr:hypothetical protein HD806DRAFT_539172 [Xylariaceae sp. AK1471]
MSAPIIAPTKISSARHDMFIYLKNSSWRAAADYPVDVLFHLESNWLRHFERDTVENAVRKLFDELYKDSTLRSNLGLRGSITFGSHTNLGDADAGISQGIESLSLVATVLEDQRLQGSLDAEPGGKVNLADEFCIYKDSEIYPERDVINVEDTVGHAATSNLELIHRAENGVVEYQKPEAISHPLTYQYHLTPPSLIAPDERNDDWRSEIADP